MSVNSKKRDQVGYQSITDEPEFINEGTSITDGGPAKIYRNPKYKPEGSGEEEQEG